MAATKDLSKKRPTAKGPQIYTLGHSNRSIEEFIDILKTQKLKLVVDVRKIPRSRHNPHFGAIELANSLRRKNIEYIYLPELAGRRPSKKDSINTAWRNSSFRAYADHMQTEEFGRGIKHLVSLSKRKRLAIMCAEAVPWRCHRRLIADALLVQGHVVLDIFTKSTVREHLITPFARVRKGKMVTYPATKKRNRRTL